MESGIQDFLGLPYMGRTCVSVRLYNSLFVSLDVVYERLQNSQILYVRENVNYTTANILKFLFPILTLS